MPDVILVVLGRPETAASLLHAAGQLGQLLSDVRINVLAVQEPVHVSPLEAEALTAEVDAVVAMKTRERERVAALEAAFDRWSTEANDLAASARWLTAEGNAAAVVGERGSRADIIVAGQPGEADKMARQLFRAALFGTDRPVLMVPDGWHGILGRCVAIAWREDKQAARAVIPALRCLAAAERVHVLLGMRTPANSPTMPKILAEHGILAELHVLPIGSSGPFGQALLNKAHEVGADLLVMGAYAHSPLRELVLGGVTRYMLTNADLPVFMRH